MIGAFNPPGIWRFFGAFSMGVAGKGQTVHLNGRVPLVRLATDIARFMQTGGARTAFFSAPHPATATVEVARLYRPEIPIEITAIAEIPRKRFKRPGNAERTGK